MIFIFRLTHNKYSSQFIYLRLRSVFNIYVFLRQGWLLNSMTKRSFLFRSFLVAKKFFHCVFFLSFDCHNVFFMLAVNSLLMFRSIFLTTVCSFLKLAAIDRLIYRRMMTNEEPKAATRQEHLYALIGNARSNNVISKWEF